MTKLKSRVPASDDDEKVDLQILIEQVVPDPQIWMLTPNSMLGGQRPVDLIKTPDESLLRNMVRAAKYGMVS